MTPPSPSEFEENVEVADVRDRVADLLGTGRLTTLRRAEGDVEPENLLATVQTIGGEFARRIVSEHRGPRAGCRVVRGREDEGACRVELEQSDAK